MNNRLELSSFLQFSVLKEGVTRALSAAQKSTTSFPISRWFQPVVHASTGQVAKCPSGII